MLPPSGENMHKIDSLSPLDADQIEFVVQPEALGNLNYPSVQETSVRGISLQLWRPQVQIMLWDKS